MGGNAFPKYAEQMARVHRDDIPPLVRHLAKTLAFPGLSEAYLLDNLMGSARRQETSGDLDFAINNKPARFIGEPDSPVFRLRDLAARVREVLPVDQVATQTLKGGQFQTIWWADGKTNGFVQCDFIEGDPEFLKLAHWSPGLDVSPFKGVWISTLFGVLAKFQKDWEKLDDDGNRLARIGWNYDLERGLRRTWRMVRRPGQGLSQSTADRLETKFADCPRFARTGFLTNPDDILRILFGKPTTLREVDTFEKAWARACELHAARFDELRSRLVDAMSRSGLRGVPVEEIARQVETLGGGADV